MRRACDVCGTTYDAKRPTSRYCRETCRKRAQRTGKAARRAPSENRPADEIAAVRALEAQDEPPGRAGRDDVDEPDVHRDPDGLVAACVAELQAAGRLHTTLGFAALSLARRIEASVLDSGSAYAALIRELRATMAAATTNAQGAGDPLDEIARAREKRMRDAAAAAAGSA